MIIPANVTGELSSLAGVCGGGGGGERGGGNKKEKNVTPSLKSCVRTILFCSITHDPPHMTPPPPPIQAIEHRAGSETLQRPETRQR